MISYLIYSAHKDAGGVLLYDFSNRVQGLTFATNNRGMAECSCFVPLDLPQSFIFHDHTGLPFVYVVDSAAAALFEGRLEDIGITGGGVNLTAFGQARALGDLPYTAFWSASGVGGWRPVVADDNPATVFNRKDKPYVMDTNNRVFIGLTKGTVYANNADVGAQAFFIPDDATNKIVGLSLDLEILLPLNWTVQVFRWTAGFGAANNIITAGASGALQKFSYNTTFTADSIIELTIFNATGAGYGPVAQENGAWYAKIANVRLVGATTNRINTTLTANRAAGVNVTATVGSTARMYVGQLLVIDSGNFGSETVTVLSIGSATQFNATFANAHVIGNPVQGHIVYGDEIVKGMLSTVTATNSTQLATSIALIQSPSLDLVDEVYEDRAMPDILDYLTGLGDNQIVPRQWEWGVDSGRLLYFRPQTVSRRTWYIDVADPNLARSLDQLVNSWYPVYQEASGRNLRGSAQSDSASIARYRLTRQQALGVDSSSATLATTEAQAALADSKDIKGRSGLTITRVYDAAGNQWPLWYVRAGDTIIMRNLPPTLSTTIDKIRSFRLSRAEYHADDDTLTIEPDAPAPRLDTILARLAVANQQRKQNAPYQRWGGVITG